MSGSTILLPFQPATMSTAQLAAVSYLASYCGRTHTVYAYQLRQWFTWSETNGPDPWAGPCDPDRPRRQRSYARQNPRPRMPRSDFEHHAEADEPVKDGRRGVRDEGADHHPQGRWAGPSCTSPLRGACRNCLDVERSCNISRNISRRFGAIRGLWRSVGPRRCLAREATKPQVTSL